MAATSQRRTPSPLPLNQSRALSDPGDVPSEPRGGPDAKTGGAGRGVALPAVVAGPWSSSSPTPPLPSPTRPLPSQRWVAAGHADKVSGLDSAWDADILCDSQGFEQPPSTVWLHSGRGLPDRRRRRKRRTRDLLPLLSRSLVRLPFQAPGLSDDEDDDPDDDKQTSAADRRPEVQEVTAEMSEDKWNALVAEKFCGYEGAQAEDIQEVFRAMQDRVCQRLDRMWTGAGGAGAIGAAAQSGEGEGEAVELARIRARRRERGQHKVDYAAAQDTDVLYSD
jgi:hypothetical protein